MFKSLFRRIRQNRLFSAIYVLGSALSIASAMLIVVYLYVKIADIYPEHDRSNIYEVYNLEASVKTGGSTVMTGSRGFPASVALAIEKSVTSAETVATELMVAQVANKVMIQPGEGRMPFAVVGRYVNLPFFRIFDYEMLHGTYFSQEDFDSGALAVVITDKLATRLFGSPEEAVGKEMRVSYDSFVVRGVIREPSFLMQDSYGQIFFPYTIRWRTYVLDQYAPKYRQTSGDFKVWAKVRDDAAADTVDMQVRQVLRTMVETLSEPEDSVFFELPPIMSVATRSFKSDDGHFSLADLMMKYGVIILLLLVVPAINLGGLIAGHMETRLPEMGVRKSFGARRGRLLRSVLTENMVLTSAGGLLGLAISLLLVWRWRDWMFFLDDNIMADAPDSVSLVVTSEMMFAPAILAMAFLLCLIVNVMAAMIPAWWSLRRPIVESLSENK